MGRRKVEDYDELPEQQKEKVCEEHMVWKVKNAVGMFVCTVCLEEEFGEEMV